MIFTLAFALFALAVPVASAVADLRQDTFKAFIRKHDVVMVEFYAHWCSICQELEPIYQEMASKYDTDKDIRFARVDCARERELCKEWPTPIYPTIRAFKGLREQQIYNGPRTPAEMIEAAEWFWLPDSYQNDTLDAAPEVFLTQNPLTNT